jgi:hypothetical protein
MARKWFFGKGQGGWVDDAKADGNHFVFAKGQSGYMADSSGDDTKPFFAKGQSGEIYTTETEPEVEDGTKGAKRSTKKK